MVIKFREAKIALSFATIALAVSLPISTQASPACQPEYERIYKTMFGTPVKNAKYCGIDCEVPSRKVTDAEVSFMLSCEKAIKGTLTGAPLSAKPTAKTVSQIIKPAANGSYSSVISSAATNRRDTYTLGGPLTSNQAFPYPIVTDGVIWVPDLKWQELTAMINLPLWADRDKERPILPQPFDEMIEANRGEELIKLLSTHAQISQSARPEADLFEIYNVGKGGVVKSEVKAWSWLLKLAAKAPIYYNQIGIAHREGTYGQTPNINTAAYYWSKGLSRGCRICGTQLIKLHEKISEYPTLPFNDDTHYRYLVFTFDVGEAYIGDKLDRFLERKAKTPEQKAVYQRAKEISIKWPDITGGLAVAINEKYRTGLVHEQLINIAKTYETKKWETTGNLFTQFNAFGRYRGIAIAQYLSWDAKKSKPEINMPFTTYLAREAVMAGDISSAPLAAYSYAGVRSFINYGNAFGTTNLDASVAMVEAYMDPAVFVGIASQSDSDSLQSLAAGNVAEACWKKSSKGYVGAYSQKKYDEMVRRTLREAGRNNCHKKTAQAQALSDGSYIVPDNIKRMLNRDAKLSADMRAERERKEKEKHRRNNRNRKEKGNYDIYTLPDHYRLTRTRICAEATVKTSYCR